MTAGPNIIAISRQVYEYKADGDRDHNDGGDVYDVDEYDGGDECDGGDVYDVDNGRCASTRPPPSPCPAPAPGSNTHLTS